MDVTRIFQRGVTQSYRGYSTDCPLNIVGCLLTKRLTRGGGGGGVTGTQDPPGYALVRFVLRSCCKMPNPLKAMKGGCVQRRRLSARVSSLPWPLRIDRFHCHVIKK